MQSCLLAAVAGVMMPQTEAPPADTAAFEVPAACAANAAEIATIEQKYAPEQAQLEEDGKDLEKRSKRPDHVSFNVTFVRKDMSFSVPQVTMHEKRFVVAVPTTTMKIHKISFKVPKITMTEVTVGWRPVCTNFHCKMKRIVTKIPQSTMENQEFSTKVPEVTMKNRAFVTSIPQFKMKRIDFAVNIPHVTLVSPIKDQSNPDPDLARDSAALEQRANALGTRIQGDISASTATLQTCVANDLAQKRADAALAFEIGINSLDATIDTIRAAGANPTAASIDGTVQNYVKLRDDLIAERDAALVQIDQALSDMKLDEETT